MVIMKSLKNWEILVLHTIRNLQNKPIYVALGGALLTLTPLALLGYGSLVVLLALILPVRLRSLTLRLVLSLLLFYSVHTIIAAVFWLMDIAGLRFLPFLSGLMLAGYTWRFRPVFIKTRLDPVGLVVALAVMVVPLVPFIKSPTLATILQLFSYQGDNLSHLELINADVKKQGYVYYTLEEIRPYAYQTLSGYPQGWHVNVAVVQDQLARLVRIHDVTYRQVLFFYAICVAMYGLLALVVYELMVLLSSRARGIGELTRRLTAAGVTIGLLLGTFMTLFAYGFQTHLMSLLMVLTIGVLLTEVWETSHDVTKRWLVVLAVLLCSGLTLTWQIIAVPTALAIFYVLLAGGVVTWRVAWFRQQWRFFGILACLTLAAAFQFYMQLRFGNDATTIIQPGLSPEPRSSFLVLIFAAGLIAVFYLARQRSSRTPEPFTALLVPAGIFSLLFYIILEIRVGEQRYYYFKSTFTVILLAVILLGAYATSQVGLLQNKLSGWRGWLMVALVVVAGVGGISLNLSKETVAFYQSTLAGMDRPLAESLAAELKKPPAERPNIMATGSCIPDQDYKASRIAQALSDDARLKTFRVNNPFDKDLKYTDIIRDFSQTRPQTETLILSHDGHVLERIAHTLGPNAKLRGINLDPHGPPKDPVRCPNFVEYKLP